MKRDYPELEGKVIKYVNPDFPEIKSALVVGVNYDIGITLVNAEDSSDYLCCLTGPASPRWKRCGGTKKAKMELHKKAFPIIIDMITDGKFEEIKLDAILEDGFLNTEQPDALTCSFAA